MEVDWFSRLRVMAGRDLCSRLIVKTSTIKIGQLLAVIFLILLRIVVVCPYYVLRWLCLRSLGLWSPKTEQVLEKYF